MEVNVSASGDGRGVLFPADLPSFHRIAAPPALQELVRWWWIPRWDLGRGQALMQTVLPFPASNLVIMPEGVSLAGPTTGISERKLQGESWAVGALLRPAAIAQLHQDPGVIRDTEIPFDAADLHEAITAAMALSDEESANERAAAAYADWITKHMSSPKQDDLTANAAEELISTDRNIVRVAQVANHFGLSVRAVQRLAQKYIGLPPLVVIRRYRLQEAAQRLREDPSLTIAQVAADLEYADQAHLTGDFRRVLGFTPSTYRDRQNQNRGS